MLFLASTAYAQTAGIGGASDSDIVNMVAEAIKRSADDLLVLAVKLLSGFMLLQFVLTNWKLIYSGDLDTVFAKFVGSMFWFGFCWFVLDNGPSFIQKVGNQFWREFASNIPTPGAIIGTTISVVGSMLVIAFAAGASLVGTVFGQAVLLLAFLIAGAGAFFAFKKPGFKPPPS